MGVLPVTEFQRTAAFFAFWLLFVAIIVAGLLVSVEVGV